MSKIVLLSGGMDSATLLWSNREQTGLALAFDYGQPHRVELGYARNLADLADVPYREIRLPSLTAQGIVFPGRNMLFLSVAVSIALAQGFSAIVFGAHRDDSEAFPDCRPAFVTAMCEVIREGYPGGPVLEAPFLFWSKRDIVTEAKRLKMPIHLTWSCYGPGPDPCQTCMACQLRNESLA